MTSSGCCVTSISVEQQKPVDRRKLRKREANSTRNRLLSIRHDVEHLYGNANPLWRRQQQQQQQQQQQNERFFTASDSSAATTDHASSSNPMVVIIANERCGSWYVPNPNAACYFKSTDGHSGVWNMSLKRLNMNVLQLVAKHGTVLIVDASASKILPDSLSRTIPIWCAVFNRIVQKYRTQNQQQQHTVMNWWDESLYTPESCVSREEHARIEQILDDRVEALYESQAIVDIPGFLEIFCKPLRPYWIAASKFQSIIQQNSGNNQKEEQQQQLQLQHDKYYNILCINASDASSWESTMKMDKTFVYTPGAGDDEESWSRGLTPRLFWDHVHSILDTNTDTLSTEQVIDDINRNHQTDDCNAKSRQRDDSTTSPSLFDTLGNTMISIGSRRAGRPPECWDQFDAILNVSDVEYENMMMTNQDEKFYLQLPVKEGKRDKSELERWMAVGVCFVGIHAQQGRRVLIHCAQGLDRSVAVAIAVVTLFCQLQFPLQFQDTFWDLPFFKLQATMHPRDEKHEILIADQPYHGYKWSGLSEGLVENFMGRQGRDKLMQWLLDHHPHVQNTHRGDPLRTGVEYCCDQNHPYKFDKRTIRIALLLTQQDREKASPTRSTMQKLHRFFLSP
jgi:tRNA A64-2'-O-ribosylphosphate transferase